MENHPVFKYTHCILSHTHVFMYSSTKTKAQMYIKIVHFSLYSNWLKMLVVWSLCICDWAAEFFSITVWCWCKKYNTKKPEPCLFKFLIHTCSIYISELKKHCTFITNKIFPTGVLFIVFNLHHRLRRLYTLGQTALSLSVCWATCRHDNQIPLDVLDEPPREIHSRCFPAFALLLHTPLCALKCVPIVNPTFSAPSQTSSQLLCWSNCQ